MKDLQTLTQCWQEFEKNAIPPDTEPRLIRRARLAFYAGAAYASDLGEIGDELREFTREIEREEKVSAA